MDLGCFLDNYLKYLKKNLAANISASIQLYEKIGSVKFMIRSNKEL